MLRSSEKWSLFLVWVVKLPPFWTIQRRATCRTQRNVRYVFTALVTISPYTGAQYHENNTQMLNKERQIDYRNPFERRTYVPAQMTCCRGSCQYWHMHLWHFYRNVPRVTPRVVPRLEPIVRVCCFRESRHRGDTRRCMGVDWQPVWRWPFPGHNRAASKKNSKPICSLSTSGRASPQRHSTGLG
jgi:hypothetical protein